jgi:hypothetical protein
MLDERVVAHVVSCGRARLPTGMIVTQNMHSLCVNLHEHAQLEQHDLSHHHTQDELGW